MAHKWLFARRRDSQCIFNYFERFCYKVNYGQSVLFGDFKNICADLQNIYANLQSRSERHTDLKIYLGHQHFSADVFNIEVGMYVKKKKKKIIF